MTNHVSKDHGRKKEFHCSICDVDFATNQTLKTHLKIHKKKLFKCETCNKCFKCKDNLNLHLQIHNEKRIGNELCKICSKSFPGIDNLFKHMEEALEIIPEHEGTKDDLPGKKKRKSKKQLGSNTCPKCGKEFGSRVVRCLKVHIKNCKGVQDYNETAKRPQQITPHQMHYQCMKCSKSFSEVSDIIRHVPHLKFPELEAISMWYRVSHSDMDFFKWL